MALALLTNFSLFKKYDNLYVRFASGPTDAFHDTTDTRMGVDQFHYDSKLSSDVYLNTYMKACNK